MRSVVQILLALVLGVSGFGVIGLNPGPAHALAVPAGGAYRALPDSMYTAQEQHALGKMAAAASTATAEKLDRGLVATAATSGVNDGV